MQLEAEHGRSEQGMEQATDKDARDENEKVGTQACARVCACVRVPPCLQCVMFFTAFV